VATQGKKSADTTLENTVWALCSAMPVGAVRRAYGADPTRASAYRTLCDDAPREDVIVTEPDSEAPPR